MCAWTPEARTSALKSRLAKARALRSEANAKAKAAKEKAAAKAALKTGTPVAA